MRVFRRLAIAGAILLLGVAVSGCVIRPLGWGGHGGHGHGERDQADSNSGNSHGGDNHRGDERRRGP